jgi:acyl-CoA thioester hydrolase
MSEKPLYVHRETIWFDELDSLGMMHNARYAVHVERAIVSWYQSLADNDPSDGSVVVKHFDIEFLWPFIQERAELTTEVSLERRGRTSVVVSFRCLSYPEGKDGPELLHARGTRTNVKISPVDLRPAPWSDRFLADL